MIATLIIQELRSFFNTPFYWTLTIVLNKKEFLLKIIKAIKTTLRNYKSERQERREFISAFLHQSAIKFFIFSNKCK